MISGGNSIVMGPGGTTSAVSRSPSVPSSYQRPYRTEVETIGTFTASPQALLGGGSFVSTGILAPLVVDGRTRYGQDGNPIMAPVKVYTASRPRDADAWVDRAGGTWNTDAGEISAFGKPPSAPTWGQFTEAVSGIAVAIAGRSAGRSTTVAAANSNQAAIQARVLGSIEASKAARLSSRFDVHIARTSQVSPPYGGVDTWGRTALAKGSIIYGGYPGQSPFYTDSATVKASNLNAKSLFQSLQVSPHPVRGYRPQVQAYRVLNDIDVPSASALANPQFGPGGGAQFYMENFSNRLAPIRTFNLSRAAE